MLHIIQARVLTLASSASSQAWASAVLCANGKILALGTPEQLRSIAPKAELLDWSGAVLTPGLTDAHIHLVSYGLTLGQLDLSKTTSWQHAARLVGEQSALLPAGTWIQGGGFHRSSWGLANHPEKAWLDEVAPHHPVMLSSRDGHSLWVNSMALDLAGIRASTPDPAGGVIVRDPQGQPAGTLLENAMELLKTQVPKPNFEALVQAAKRGAQRMADHGFTCVHTMALEPSDHLRALLELEARNELPLRIWACIPHANLEQAKAIGLRGGHGQQVKICGAKFFADGALGSRTAWMLEDYVGFPGERGVQVDDRETIIERGRLALELGLSPVAHAIGDRANREVLDAFEALKPLADAQSLRLRLEHAQHLAPSELGRLAQLGVVASMQAIHLPGDTATIDRLLGPDRASRSFATRTLHDAGTVIALGSDAPVATPDPSLGIEAAVHHRDQHGQTWREGQALTRLEVLEGYTRHAAFAAGWEHWYGQIVPGHASEFTLWETDPSIGPARILQALRLG